MAIQYAGGTNVNSTFTCTTGTRQEIVTGLQDALIAAGWTVISGLNTATVLLESATTPSPQNLLCRVQLLDPGSGNCAQVKFRNAGNTKSQAGQLYLIPQAGKVFRVIACRYQFFIFSADSITTSRSYVGGGVPYLPSFLQGVITECIWAQGNCNNSDSSTQNNISFRISTATGFSNLQANQWNCVNGNILEINGPPFGAEYRPGCQSLMAQRGSINNASFSQQPAYRWHDGSVLTYEPLITWGLTSINDEPLIRGQLWDSAIISGQYVADQTTTFDSRNWWVFTNNTQWDTVVFGGTLVIVIP